MCSKNDDFLVPAIIYIFMLELNTNLLPMCALYIFIIRVYCFYYNMNGFQMSDYRFFFCTMHVSSSYIIYTHTPLLACLTVVLVYECGHYSGS